MRLPLRQISRRQFLWASALATVGLGVYPWFAEHRFVRVNRYRVPVPRLPEAFRGFTIAQVTDPHLGPMLPPDFLAGVIARANALGADLIAVTGDYVHGRGTPDLVDCVWEVMAPLRAPEGVFAILGNHDYGQEDQAKERLAASGWNLHDKAIPIRRNGQTLWLAGTGDHWRDRLPLDPLLERIPPTDCRIVLAHNPDTADTTHRQPVDLFLSGHTHGGQVRFPFVGTPDFALPVRNKAYTSGLKRSVHGEPVFICRGIGWSILPVRFLCLPELAVLELVPAEDRA